MSETRLRLTDAAQAADFAMREAEEAIDAAASAADAARKAAGEQQNLLAHEIWIRHRRMLEDAASWIRRERRRYS